MTDKTVRMEWSKFYWSDWEGDDQLALCSLPAQGLWVRMLCSMAKAKPPGYLIVGGAPMTMQDLAFLVRLDVETVSRLVHEMETRGVFSRTENGTIYSRRMVRNYEEYMQFVEAGKRGGRPLKQQLNPSNNPPVKPPGYKNTKGEGKTPRLAKTERGGHNHTEAEADAESICDASSAAAYSHEPEPPRARQRPTPRKGAAAARSAPPKPNKNPDLIPSGRYEWPEILVICREDKCWWPDEFGPAPGEPGCFVPEKFLEAGDGLGWVQRATEE